MGTGSGAGAGGDTAVELGLGLAYYARNRVEVLNGEVHNAGFLRPIDGAQVVDARQPNVEKSPPVAVGK